MILPESNQTKLRLVVVGNGMVSFALLKELVGLGVHRDLEISVLGEEPRPAYDRVHLTELFSGKTADDLLLAPTQWYAEHGIELITGERAISLDRANRKVITAAGSKLEYDHCILATGSRPFIPPIEGADLPRVFEYRTVEDLDKIRSCAEECRSAAVMGGGLLGLEAAKALYDLGLKTRVFEMAPGLMPRQLDADCAALLKEEIESLGVEVHLLKTTTSIAQKGKLLEIGFAHSDPIHADMLVISAGIRPCDELARDAGLECGPRGGIAVDDQLRTSDPRIHAIGECAAKDGKLYGLVGPCYQMARVVAKNFKAMIDGEGILERFEGASEAAQLKLMGVEVSTLGTPIGQQEDCVLLSRRSEGAARTLMVQKRRVVGAIGVGPWPERERISDLISTRKKLSWRNISRFEKTAEVWPHKAPMPVSRWPASATVCSCLKINRGKLTDAIGQGCCEVEQIAAATGASSVCGSCRPLIASMLGAQAGPVEIVGWRTLLIASAVAAVLALCYAFAKPLPFAESVQADWHAIDFLWRESVAKQITGFTLLGVSAIALLLSLRKRWNWFQLGDYGLWRSLHGIVGVLTLLGFFVHTGMRLGSNFTFALAIVFLALNLLGSMTGIVAALESKIQGEYARYVRFLRPRLTELHIWLFWPLPVLVLFHVISVYYY